ncbi:RidA family protein [Nisaea sp.]|uniref:RidA family protein n=1 Tax=Nisaea sp. TaxID=2024842 RepID=UPI003296A6AE
MDIKRYRTGERMSQVVVHGNTVYTAGQVAQNAPGASVADQTKDILANLDALLAEAGTEKSKLLTATIWLNSMDDFAEMNAVWDGWVVAGSTPCRACVESPKLASPKYTVEIMAIAAL